jgi:hypothetical protein
MWRILQQDTRRLCNATGVTTILEICDHGFAEVGVTYFFGEQEKETATVAACSNLCIR